MCVNKVIYPQFFFVISNGASCHGASCPWGELSVGRVVMGRVVHGASCPWGELSMGRVLMGRVVRGASLDGASGPGTGIYHALVLKLGKNRLEPNQTLARRWCKMTFKTFAS